MKFHNTEQIEAEIAASAQSPITSTTLTPHELYLLRKLGYEPVRVVFGNVVYSMGAKGLFRTLRGLFRRGEMVDFSRLNTDARQLGLARLMQEAEKLKADLVVGVRIDARELADFVEIICTGTAVRKVAEPDLSNETAVGV